MACRRSSVRPRYAPPVISISPVNPCDLPGFFMSAKPPCLQVVRTKITTSRPPFGRFPSGGLFAFQTPVSADFSLTCGQKVHTPCRGQRRNVTSPFGGSYFNVPKRKRDDFSTWRCGHGMAFAMLLRKPPEQSKWVERERPKHKTADFAYNSKSGLRFMDYQSMYFMKESK